MKLIGIEIYQFNRQIEIGFEMVSITLTGIEYFGTGTCQCTISECTIIYIYIIYIIQKL